MLDSGSNITCILDHWFQENKKNLGKFEELPTTGIFIKTAVGTKSRRANKIIMIPVKIQEQSTTMQFLLVPNLIKPIIIGVDKINEWKMKMDFHAKQANISINNQTINVPFKEDRTNGILCHILQDQDLGGDMHSSPESNEISYEQIEGTLNNNPLLNNAQRKQLINLIFKYKKCFTDQPGLCNKYQHHLLVENPETFECHSYPVPIIHQEAVKIEIERMEELNIERSDNQSINPNELFFGSENKRFWSHYIPPNLNQPMPLERKIFIAHTKLKHKQSKRAETLNKKYKPNHFNIHDLVLVKSHSLSNQLQGETAKLFELYEGPHKIHEILGKATYNLCDINNRNILGPYHITSLKKYYPKKQTTLPNN